MTKDKKSFDDGETQVKNNNEAIQRLKQEANILLKNAKIEAHEQMAEVLAKSNKEIQETLDVRKMQIEKELQCFEQELELESKELKNALLGQAPLFKEGLKIKLAS